MIIRRRRTVLKPRPDLAAVPVSIESLVKEYAGGYRAVDDVSFTVERGQVVGLLGPNGAGKTTTLRVLVGLITPTSGTVHVFGDPVVPGAPVLARLGRVHRGTRLPAAPVRPREPAAVLGGHRPSRGGSRLRHRARDRRARRVRRPAGEDLQPRHEAAPRHRAGDARPARAAGARRADQRPRPAADRRDARGHEALRRRPDGRWWCPATCWPRSSRPARTSSSCTRAR